MSKTIIFDTEATGIKEPVLIEAAWLERLCLTAGFVSALAVPQHKELIYADFRYDLIARS